MNVDPHGLDGEAAGVELATACKFGRADECVELLRHWRSTRSYLFVQIGDQQEPSFYLTPAMFAAVKACQYPVTKILLDHNFPLEDDSIKSAVLDGSIRFLELFQAHGWDINAPQRATGGPPHLANAVVTNDKDLVQWFLDRGADPSRKGAHGTTPLTVAAGASSLEIVKMLLDAGAKTSRSGVLHAAIRSQVPGRVAIVELLLDRGADINELEHSKPAMITALGARGGSNGTPLHVAVEENNMPIVKLLLERGADNSIKDSQGRVALSSM